MNLFLGQYHTNSPITSHLSGLTTKTKHQSKKGKMTQWHFLVLRTHFWSFITNFWKHPPQLPPIDPNVTIYIRVDIHTQINEWRTIEFTQLPINNHNGDKEEEDEDEATMIDPKRWHDGYGSRQYSPFLVSATSHLLELEWLPQARNGTGENERYSS